MARGSSTLTCGTWFFGEVLSFNTASISCGEVVLCGDLVAPEKIIVFFGNQASQISELQEHFPNLQFQRLAQVHKTGIFPSTYKTVCHTPEADAHWTQDKNMALCINTADCIPVLIFDPQTLSVAAVHAGWKGVRDKIVPKTILQLLEACGACAEDLWVFIGPHIQAQSFEIEDSIKDEILKTVSANNFDVQTAVKPSVTGKSFVNLNRVVCGQTASLGVSPEKIYSSTIDTKTDPNYFSYRRDPKNPGRQISFIAKL